MVLSPGTVTDGVSRRLMYVYERIRGSPLGIAGSEG